MSYVNISRLKNTFVALERKILTLHAPFVVKQPFTSRDDASRIKADVGIRENAIIVHYAMKGHPNEHGCRFCECPC
jgi:hypothetical protein